MALWRKAYNKQFDGYELRTTYDANGNEKIRYVYTKEYYQPQIGDKMFIFRKILHWILLILAAATLAFAGTRHIYVNFQTLVTIFQSVGVLGIIATAIYVIYYTVANKKMKADTYKNSHTRLMTIALITCIAHACTFLCALVYFFIDPITKDSFEFLCVGLYLIAALCFGVIWFLENKTTYIILPPDQF